MSDDLFLPICQPVALMECFLRVAELNTAKNLETCGILAGTLVCASLESKQNNAILGCIIDNIFCCRKREPFM